MINRRLALQSFLSFTAAAIAGRSGFLFGSLHPPRTFATEDSSSTLAELLQSAIRLCRTMRSVPRESRRLCEIALVRVQQSAETSPAFWQACADSVSRLEVAVSGDQNTHSREERAMATALDQFRSLRKLLADKAVQEIGRMDRFA
jgi:hypothetical protein